MLLKKIPSGLCLALFILCLGFQNGESQKTQTSETLRTNGRPFTHVKRISIAKSAACVESEWRTIDGTCNNSTDPGRYEWGSSDITLMREMDGEFGANDPFNAMNGEERVSPRAVSNALCTQEEDIPNSRNLSSMVFTWGQFVDHDISLTPEGHEEYAPVRLPADEPLFTSDIPFFRSEIAEGTGELVPRNQRNLITSWIDASNVYGSDIDRANWLRTFEQGKLKMSSGDLLPFNTLDGEYGSAFDETAPGMAGDMDREGNLVKTYVAGDVRAAEQPGLTSLHTLFVREHNRVCDLLVEQGFTDDEKMYQIARKWVGALIQQITYNEFLPSLGMSMGSYNGYDSDVQPDIFNMFATAAYRLGHTMVSNELLLVDAQCRDDGTLGLMESFFNPDVLREHNIGRVLNGLNKQEQEEVDLQIIDNLRNFLFGDASADITFGLDLASLNIQRGRDHGMPDYNSIREHFTGERARKFRDVTRSGDRQNVLREVYRSVDNIDAWTGLLAEDHVSGSSLGPTLKKIMEVQFGRLRDCDFYYFEKDAFFNSDHIAMIKSARLSDIMIMNTGLNRLGANVFFQSSCGASNYGGEDLLPIFNEIADQNNDNDNNGDGGNNNGDGNGNNGNGNNNNGNGGNNNNNGNGGNDNNNGNGGNGNNNGGNGNGNNGNGGNGNNNGGNGNGNNGNGGNGNNNGGNGNNNNGNGGRGNINTGASTLITVPTTNITFEDNISIGPNPTTDIVEMNVTFSEPVIDGSYTVTDLSGQVMFQLKNGISGNSFSDILDFTLLSPGTYLLNILNKDGAILQTEKIIVSK